MTASSARRRRPPSKFFGFIYCRWCNTDFNRRFGSFFNHIDHFPQEHFLYTTAGGIAAAKLATAPTDSSEKPKAESGGKKIKDEKDALAAVEGAEEEETAPPPKEGNQ